MTVVWPKFALFDVCIRGIRNRAKCAVRATSCSNQADSIVLFSLPFATMFLSSPRVTYLAISCRVPWNRNETSFRHTELDEMNSVPSRDAKATERNVPGMAKSGLVNDRNRGERGTHGGTEMVD